MQNRGSHWNNSEILEYAFGRSGIQSIYDHFRAYLVRCWGHCCNEITLIGPADTQYPFFHVYPSAGGWGRGLFPTLRPITGRVAFQNRQWKKWKYGNSAPLSFGRRITGMVPVQFTRLSGGEKVSVMRVGKLKQKEVLHGYSWVVWKNVRAHGHTRLAFHEANTRGRIGIRMRNLTLIWIMNICKGRLHQWKITRLIDLF